MLKKILEFVFEVECWISRKWVASAHKRLMQAQWSLQPNPEFFDHHLDLYQHWSESRSSFWLERGVFGSLALKGGQLLELACGDGFNSKHFYSLRSKSVIACDFDPTALATAKCKNSAPNVEFRLADIRNSIPTGSFENVVWDAAIEHFTPTEIESIMKTIKSRLTSDGILSGHTIVEREDGQKHLHQHEYEFKDMADLDRFLKPFFKNVKVFETIFPSRHNLYFWASDGVLPFDKEWPRQLTSAKS